LHGEPAGRLLDIVVDLSDTRSYLTHALSCYTVNLSLYSPDQYTPYEWVKRNKNRVGWKWETPTNLNR